MVGALQLHIFTVESGADLVVLAGVAAGVEIDDECDVGLGNIHGEGEGGGAFLGIVGPLAVFFIAIGLYVVPIQGIWIGERQSERGAALD